MRGESSKKQRGKKYHSIVQVFLMAYLFYEDMNHCIGQKWNGLDFHPSQHLEEAF